MSRQSIKIDHLEIRLKGISPDVARSAVDGLGQNLLDQLSSVQGLSLKNRAINIGKTEPSTLHVAAGAKPNELRSAIGERIATSIRSKLR